MKNIDLSTFLMFSEDNFFLQMEDISAERPCVIASQCGYLDHFQLSDTMKEAKQVKNTLKISNKNSKDFRFRVHLGVMATLLCVIYFGLSKFNCACFNAVVPKLFPVRAA